jgi:hypothetical protein
VEYCGCCRHPADAVTFPLTATDTLKRVPITAAFTQKKWIFGPAIRSARNRGQLSTLSLCAPYGILLLRPAHFLDGIVKIVGKVFNNAQQPRIMVAPQSFTAAPDHVAENSQHRVSQAAGESGPRSAELP